MASVGDVVVLGVGAHLEIFDASNPTALSPVAETANLPRAINAIAVDGDTAFVTYAGLGAAQGGPIPGGLRILDLADPAQPTELGGVDGLAEARDVAVRPGLAFVADGESGLKVVDVSLPSSPAVVGAVAGAVHAVAASGSHVYGLGPGIRAIDASNAAAPIEVAQLADPSGMPADGVVVGSKLYVVGSTWAEDSEEGSLTVVDVSNPAKPGILGSIANLPGKAVGVAVEGNLAYIATRGAGLRIVDVANPNAPIEVGALDDMVGSGISLAAGSHVAVSEGMMYGTNGVSLIDVSVPTAPARVARHDAPVASDLGLAGNILYVCDYDRGLVAYDVADPSSPTWLGEAAGPPGSIFVDAALDGDRAYAIVREGGGSTRPAGLWVVDVADPSAPAFQGVADLPRYAAESVGAGGYAFVAAGASGVLVVDAADPQAPAVVATVADGLFAQRLALAGSTLAVLGAAPGGSRGVTLVDVAVPSAPVVRGHVALSMAEARGVAMAGGMVYAVGMELEGSGPTTTGAGRLAVVDAHDADQPALVAELALAHPASGIALAGDLAVVGNDDVTLVDVSNPYAPVALDALETPGPAYQVVAGAGELVAVREAGVLLLQIGEGGPGVHDGGREAFAAFLPRAVAGR